jgi:hypothetical protein
MGIKASLSKPYARAVVKDIMRWSMRAEETQRKVLLELISKARNTAFGRDHQLEGVSGAESFAQHVPVRDFEGLKAYVERAKNGERDVLWPGLPLYLCKTSGTTSGTKYIPLTRDSMPNHIHSARNALLCYIHHSGNTRFLDGKMIFLQGSPELDKTGAVPVGRLSGIVAHYVPKYLQRNRMPSWETNCIDDWETKVEAIARETMTADMRLISGIPSWVQMYYEKLLQLSGKETIGQLFPNLSLFIYGGVNFEPYRSKFEALVGRKIDVLETYPASEGFIAFQDKPESEGLLLVLNKGVYYEFIRADAYFTENPRRHSIGEVELGVNYAVLMSTNAGMWGYSIGDTVKFVSRDPYRIIVTGRIKHFTSAFGEHVIAEEVEASMAEALLTCGGEVAEFHLAPQVNPPEGLPYHEWFIEWSRQPEDMGAFARELEAGMMRRNVYYRDLINGHVLQNLVITHVQPGGFVQYMKSIGKLGGQNKVARLSNDRTMADGLSRFKG